MRHASRSFFRRDSNLEERLARRPVFACCGRLFERLRGVAAAALERLSWERSGTMITAKDPLRRQLLDVWQQLASENQRSLCQFAEFLLERQAREQEEVVPVEPLPIPAPDGETAVKALKRLKKSYPMIDADMTLLDEASRLVMKRAMGATDREVVVELEALFTARYQGWLAAREAE